MAPAQTALSTSETQSTPAATAGLPLLRWLAGSRVKTEQVIFALILLAAVITRFYDLESRVMSHDESLHTYYSWQLSEGREYKHDPMMHGPFQFHIVALSYFLLGDSDFSARVPAVLFGIASVAFLWAFRPYIGMLGALAAAVLMVISPYMLYYSRYVRNESFVVLFGLVTIWSILRYLETRQARYLFWLVAALSLHFSTKETAFIYTAQALLFLGLVLLRRVTSQVWQKPAFRTYFLLSLLAATLLLGLTAGILTFEKPSEQFTATEVLAPALPEGAGVEQNGAAAPSGSLSLFAGAAGLLALILAAFFLLSGFTIASLRQEPSFDLILVISAAILPLFAPIPIKLLGWRNPDVPGAIYSMTQTDIQRYTLFILPLALAALLIGLWWNRRVWLQLIGVFYGIFIALHTTLFQNPGGFYSGMVGSLGYWLAQQGVQRGSQPWYYYLLVQIPLYEYLPLLASLLAGGFLLLWLKKRPPEKLDAEQESENKRISEKLALDMLVFWTISSFAAYTIAGEKMPWLTVHITLPMILLGGWGIAQLLLRVDWNLLRQGRNWLALVLSGVLVLNGLYALGLLLGADAPFQGKELAQLQDTSRFLLAVLLVGLSLILLRRFFGQVPAVQSARLSALMILGLLAFTTARAAFQATYINYDQANEYLVYAHSARGVKDVLDQVRNISMRTTDGMAVKVAYDDDTSWPMSWYMRTYPNSIFYGGDPGKSLRESPLIIVGDNNFAKIEPVVGSAYLKFDYIRMVWPNQDYFDLNLSRITGALSLPAFRSALFDIWLNRDHDAYAKVFGKDLSLKNWSPVDRMRLYVRKDIAAQLWEYATGPLEAEVIADPYEGKGIDLAPDQLIGSGSGSLPGQLNRPRDLSIAPDGSLYVADTENNRIQHFSPTGELLHNWGSFGDAVAAAAPGGTFNQPWGIAVAPDGSAVFVADTWNHRIQKFTLDGQFLTMWGYFGTAETPDGFWGPRDVFVDHQGRVFVTDTGNKRIAVFDSDGVPITEFGEFGLDVGQFDEPVGLAIDGSGRLYVADTWNQRIQVFAELTPNQYAAVLSWNISGWYGQSLDNKPFLTVSQDGYLFAADPEGQRVLQFDLQGNIIRYWGDTEGSASQLNLVAGLAIDQQGGIWAVDTGKNLILHYSLP